MNESCLEAITALDLPLSWDVIRIGWEGIGAEGRLLSLDDVRKYADHDIVSAPPTQIGDVAELCTAVDEREVGERLERLAPTPSDRARRIWRAVLLHRLLQSPQVSPIEILTELTGFWGSFGYPSDSPHIIQGRSNSISPTDYYTQEMADRAIQAHRLWLEREIESIRRSQESPHRR
jgi:hypothetical protein